MSTSTHSDHDDECDVDRSLLPALLAVASALGLGYVLGRVSYGHDLRAALQQAEESSEPTTISFRTL